MYYGIAAKAIAYDQVHILHAYYSAWVWGGNTRDYLVKAGSIALTKGRANTEAKN